MLFLRNISSIEYFSTLYNFLLNFDYTILLLVSYYLFLKKENKLTIKNHFEFTLTKILNDNLSFEDIKIKVKSIKEKYQNFKSQNIEHKIAWVIYVTLFIIQELLTFTLLIYIATLNHYLIECLFILTAFLISKKTFGAFHFKSFILCFFVSNITFFILSSITMSVTTSFVLPISIGISLSYVASRFIKKRNITPYRGMSKEELNHICKEKNLTDIETNILTDFYCNRETLTKLTIKYNYSQSAICLFKSEAIKKVEA